MDDGLRRHRPRSPNPPKIPPTLAPFLASCFIQHPAQYPRAINLALGLVGALAMDDRPSCGMAQDLALANAADPGIWIDDLDTWPCKRSGCVGDLAVGPRFSAFSHLFALSYAIPLE